MCPRRLGVGLGSELAGSLTSCMLAITESRAQMLDPIHPFPARMAPEIAFDFLKELPAGSTVLDPMCGSGVSLRSAVQEGHLAIGNDADPLAVLMSKVWTENSPHNNLTRYAERLVARAKRYSNLELPWQDEKETVPFTCFWFGRKQRTSLAKLALALRATEAAFPQYISRALELALSRLIITKKRGASLAWDISHSRPHIKKKPSENDFDVFEEFLLSSATLSKKLADNKHSWSSKVLRGDARNLRLAENTVDAIITSPPYLNAIDYMRGHRLSLVWLGYPLSELRDVRSTSIGSETIRRARLTKISGARNRGPDARTQRLIDQYIHDLGQLTRELKRVAKRGAKVCVISANSNLRGYEVRTNSLIHAAAAGAGLTLVDEKIRLIEKKRRYLPTTNNRALKLRMMEEHIQYFVA